MKRKKMTAKELVKKGVPAVLIPGLIMAGVLGWKGEEINKAINYYQIKTIFPEAGVVEQVEDGDTFNLKNGVRVRLLGIDAPGRGVNNYQDSKQLLESIILGQKVFLEYDRYQDDKYGRVLSWVWIECENNPKFLPPDYMHLSNNSSRPGLAENPEGCKNGKLVNEELVKSGLVSFEKYDDRGELKYEKRIQDNTTNITNHK